MRHRAELERGGKACLLTGRLGSLAEHAGRACGKGLEEWERFAWALAARYPPTEWDCIPQFPRTGGAVWCGGCERVYRDVRVQPTQMVNEKSQLFGCGGCQYEECNSSSSHRTGRY